jgi:hypothetical protein
MNHASGVCRTYGAQFETAVKVMQMEEANAPA